MYLDYPHIMKYILFYKGPATLPVTSHKGWPTWFNKLGNALIDIGSPLANGIAMHSDGSTTNSDSAATLNGYSIIQAKDKNEVLELIKDHPYLALGKEYTIEIFEKK